MIPLYGFLEGDTLGVLILARPEETLAELAERLQHSAALRVAPSTRLRVFRDGVLLPPEQTVEGAGLTALDRFAVRRGEDGT